MDIPDVLMDFSANQVFAFALLVLVGVVVIVTALTKRQQARCVRRSRTRMETAEWGTPPSRMLPYQPGTYCPRSMRRCRADPQCYGIDLIESPETPIVCRRLSFRECEFGDGDSSGEENVASNFGGAFPSSEAVENTTRLFCMHHMEVHEVGTRSEATRVPFTEFEFVSNTSGCLFMTTSSTSNACARVLTPSKVRPNCFTESSGSTTDLSTYAESDEQDSFVHRLMNSPPQPILPQETPPIGARIWREALEGRWTTADTPEPITFWQR